MLAVHRSDVGRERIKMFCLTVEEILWGNNDVPAEKGAMRLSERFDSL